jgi:hypothetical protein
VEYLHIVLWIVSSLGSLFVGLIVFGLRKQVEVIDQKIETVRQEFHGKLAEAGNEFYTKVNGNYLRKDLFNQLDARVNRIESKVDKSNK